METGDWKAAPRLFVLKFDIFFERFTSKPFNYDRLIETSYRDVAVLDFRTALNTARAAAFDPKAHGNEGSFVMSRVEEYLARLAYLMAHADKALPSNQRDLSFTTWWQSAFSAGGGFLGIGGGQISTGGPPRHEQAMMLWRWIAAAWSHAQGRMERVYSSDGHAPSVEMATECVTTLRAAAGAAKFLADELMVSVLQDVDHPLRGGTPETTQWFPRALNRVLLGQAQYVVAYRSYLKAANFGLTATLYIASSDFFEEASKILREEGAGAAAQGPLQDLRRFIALHSTLAVARARSCMVRQLMAEYESGRAAVAAKHAENELAQCSYVSEGNREWAAIFQDLQEEATQIWTQVDLERRRVYSQPLSQERPQDLPAGKKLVAELPYSLPFEDYNLNFEKL